MYSFITPEHSYSYKELQTAFFLAQAVALCCRTCVAVHSIAQEYTYM